MARDNLTPEQRSYCMSRVKNKDTGLELRFRSALHRRGLRFRKNATELPGRPDVVFPKARVVVFVDGDFWHGYQFQDWADKLSPFWRNKIGANIRRDAKNRKELESRGWRVLSFWQHELEADFEACVDQVVKVIRQS